MGLLEYYVVLHRRIVTLCLRLAGNDGCVFCNKNRYYGKPVQVFRVYKLQFQGY